MDIEMSPAAVDTPGDKGSDDQATGEKDTMEAEVSV